MLVSLGFRDGLCDLDNRVDGLRDCCDGAMTSGQAWMLNEAKR